MYKDVDGIKIRISNTDTSKLNELSINETSFLEYLRDAINERCNTDSLCSGIYKDIDANYSVTMFDGKNVEFVFEYSNIISLGIQSIVELIDKLAWQIIETYGARNMR